MKPQNEAARFTIILPVYNGGAYLKECVQSILSQTCGEFEVAALDDASTDGSREWLQSVEDPRVTVYPSPGRLGIAGNWARALDIPKREFMTILGQDDLLDPDYLRVMDGLIARCPDAGLYHAHFRFIGSQGETLRRCCPMPERMTPVEYLTALLTLQGDIHATGYLMRSADYVRIGGIPAFERLLYADFALWNTLTRISYKATATEECFSVRQHTGSTTRATDKRLYLLALSQYMDYIIDLRAHDSLLAPVIDRYGPAYFLYRCQSAYADLIDQDTRQGRVFEAGETADMTATLAELFPNMAGEIPRTARIRLRTFLNRRAPTRLLYIALLNLFDGLRRRGQ